MDRTQYEKDLLSYFDSLPPQAFEQAHCIFCGKDIPVVRALAEQWLKPDGGVNMILADDIANLATREHADA